MDKIINLEDWSLWYNPGDYFYFTGKTANHPRWPDQMKDITTSPIKEKRGNVFITSSGSQYKIGEIDEATKQDSIKNICLFFISDKINK